MATYTIIGGDNKEYGPISAEDIRQWIKEGRLSHQTRIKSDTDTDWRTLGTLPEFADAFQPAAPPTIGALPGAVPTIPLSSPGSTDFLNSDYDLDIMGCFSEGWELLKNNFGLLWVATIVYIAIEIGLAFFRLIPILGILVGLANFVISGALMGGLLYLFVRANRGEPVGVGDMFAGFGRWFGHLFLGVLVPGLIGLICMAPVITVAVIKFMPLILELKDLQPGTPPTPEMTNAMFAAMGVLGPIFFVCMLPAIFLSTCWRFTLPIILDKQVGFWTAMKFSWKMVMKHWWHVFGLLILISLLNLAGALACCVGLLFTIPLGYAVLIKAYETIFGSQKV